MTTQYEKGYNLGYAQCLQDLEGFINGLQLTEELKAKNVAMLAAMEGKEDE